jgi:flagellar assembly factor FliW
MSTPASAVVDPPADADPAAGAIVIDTRFGRFGFDPAQTIEFARGLMGFPAHRIFGLTALPDPRFDQFMLLQSLTDASLSFLVLPVTSGAGPIAPEDLEAERAALEIDPKNLAVVLVVSIRKVGGEAQVSVNLRAPVFLDAGRRVGAQVVLTNGNYPIRHVLASRPAAKAAVK